MGFSNERNARRVMSRIVKATRQVRTDDPPRQTRLVYFRPPRVQADPGEKAGSFDFLGFTHHWARVKTGTLGGEAETAKGRFTKALQGIRTGARIIAIAMGEQWTVLTQKVKGHYGYYRGRQLGESRPIS